MAAGVTTRLYRTRVRCTPLLVPPSRVHAMVRYKPRWVPIPEHSSSDCAGFSGEADGSLEVPMKLQVTIDRDEDGVFVVECPAIPGCVSQGRTEAEALANIKDAIRECLSVRAERGMPLTVPTIEIEVATS